MDICEYFFYKPSSLYIYMYIIVKCKYHKITIYLQQINKIPFLHFSPSSWLQDSAWVHPQFSPSLAGFDVDLVTQLPLLFNVALQSCIQGVLWIDEAKDIMVLTVHRKRLFCWENWLIWKIFVFVFAFLDLQYVMRLVWVGMWSFIMDSCFTSDMIYRSYLWRPLVPIKVNLLKLFPDFLAKLLVHLPVFSDVLPADPEWR